MGSHWALLPFSKGSWILIVLYPLMGANGDAIVVLCSPCAFRARFRCYKKSQSILEWSCAHRELMHLPLSLVMTAICESTLTCDSTMYGSSCCWESALASLSFSVVSNAHMSSLQVKETYSPNHKSWFTSHTIHVNAVTLCCSFVNSPDSQRSCSAKT